jgi:invasion protein IalB
VRDMKLRCRAAICGVVLATTVASAVAQTPTPPTKPASAVPAEGQPNGVTGQRFGAWILACPPPDQAKAACVLVQEVSEALSRKVVFVWLIQYDDKGQLLGAFRLPSGVFVNRGLILKTDAKSDGLRVDYTRCDPGECQAVFPITNDVAKELAGAKTVTVAIFLTSGKTADVELNMDGFTGALSALAAKSKAAK